ncbi:hypothetical protein [Psychrobacter sp. TWP2-1-2]|uniref:hypothetical protein n=1 Tax=Psychrobacter sp. TWP2-1-2 TaxID=2804623 RepID=UPI003CE680DD
MKMLKSIKGKALAAVIAVVFVIMAYTVVGNVIGSKPIKSGTNIITGEVMDFENAKPLDEAYSVLRDYANEVNKMPENRERKSFIKEVDKAISSGNADMGLISVKEWNTLNDKFQKIHDEYQIEIEQPYDEYYKKKYNLK